MDIYETMTTDRRTAKTKNAFKQALLQLLKTKELDKITISELSEIADVSRMAFYYHYEDIFHLYQDLEKTFFSEFTNLYDKSESHDYRDNMLQIMIFLRKNANAVKYFASKSGDNQFRTRFASTLENQFREIVMYEMDSTQLSDHLNYMVTYHSAGIYAVYMKWIESDFAWSNEQVLDLIHEIDEACDSLYYP